MRTITVRMLLKTFNRFKRDIPPRQKETAAAYFERVAARLHEQKERTSTLYEGEVYND